MDLNKPVIISIISSLITLIVGLVLGRFLKTRGKIRCDLAKWDIIFHKPDKQGGYDRCKYSEAVIGHYTIELDFFNEKDVQTGLKNICIIFERSNKTKTKIAPESDDFRDESSKGIIKLPSREIVRFRWFGVISGSIFNDLEDVMYAKKAYLVGYLPNGKKFKKIIIKQPLINLLDEKYESLQDSVRIKQ